MGGSVGGFVGDLVNVATLGTVDIRKKEKQQQMQVQEAQHDKDVQTKRIKTRQNIFNLAGVQGEELKKGEVKTGNGLYSA